MAEVAKDTKILVTGAGGFIGKNLVCELRNRGYQELFLCEKETSQEEWEQSLEHCDFIFHLAGVNRPERVEEYLEGNLGETSRMLTMLQNRYAKVGVRKKQEEISQTERKKVPIVFTSSIQAKQDNPYGRSKRAAEETLLAFQEAEQSPVVIYRLPHVFGKWCRPNYNSVVATFCHNITHQIPIQINDPKTELTFVYIDDVVEELIDCMETFLRTEGCWSWKEEKSDKTLLSEEYQEISICYPVTLQRLADLLYSFFNSRKSLSVPDLADDWEKKLYSTYLSYLPKDGFSYPLKMNTDERGSFTEFLRTDNRGQVSVNVAKPGITKGNHWHHTKNEKFLVVRGEALLQFRKVGEEEILEYRVSGEKLEVVDIPTGYTHNITNIGTEDLVTVIWANEPFDPKKPDTWYEKV